MKKNKAQRIGIRPEWVKKYIGIPLLTIVLVVMVATITIIKFKEYADFEIQKEMNNKIMQESISAEESIIAESKRAKAEAIAEEKAKKECLAKIEIETRKTNTLYENKVSRKVMPVGTYLKNTKNNRVGRVVGYYGLEVITNNEWNFAIDSNGIVPDYINVIGYREFTKNLEKQKKQEEKANKIANADKIQKLIDLEIEELSKKTKTYFGNYNHFLLNGKKYRIIDVNGSDLIVLEKNKKNKKYNYETITLSNQIKPISFTEYEINKE